MILQGYHSLQSYRVAHALWNQGRRILASALQSRISEVVFIFILFKSGTMCECFMRFFFVIQVFGVDIHPGKFLLYNFIVSYAILCIVSSQCK